MKVDDSPRRAVYPEFRRWSMEYRHEKRLAIVVTPLRRQLAGTAVRT
jgi:hypothetical protein